MRKPVQSAFVLGGDSRVGLQVPAYDPGRPLVIDPIIAYSTYLGGSNDDRGYGIAVDGGGNAYLTGYTTSINFPGTTGSTIQATHGGGTSDAFVTKINAAGSAILYSTYLGGSSYDFGSGIAVDASGSAYVTGNTYSTNFPGTSSSTIQPAHGGGGYDAFVTKLNAAGSAILYSTYLGGSGSDDGRGIAVDTSGNAYVTGQTLSSNFPGTSTSAIQPTHGGGGGDAFVTKINAAGSAIIYSTYLGGSGGDFGQGIAVDASGSAYITGATSSTNFPGTTGSTIRATNGGGFDAFVTRINAAGSAILYSTYLGGGGYDVGYGIAVDASGNGYITGYTSSTNFSGTSSSAIQATYGGGGLDAFVTKINAAGSAILYSTYLGGSGDDFGQGIGADASGSAFVTGFTSSTNFPGTTGSAIQATHGGGSYDAFMTRVNAGGSALLYSTYLGGSGDDYGQGIALDASGDAYVTGITSSTNFPGTSSSSIQATNGGGTYDAFVAKIRKRYTATSVRCTPNPGFVNTATTCTVTVADTDSGTKSITAGNVSFGSSGSGTFSNIGSCALSPVSSTSTGCSVSYTPYGRGEHSITATYSGDDSHHASSGSAVLTAISSTVIGTPALPKAGARAADNGPGLGALALVALLVAAGLFLMHRLKARRAVKNNLPREYRQD
jgi:hypothetical protein